MERHAPRTLGLGLLVGIALSSCIQVGTFQCIDDAECRSDGNDGRCLAQGCAHPDDACESGERYSRYAQPDVSGRCVPTEAEPGSGTDDTGDSASVTTAAEGSDDAGSESTTGPPPPPEVCNGVDDDGDGLIDEWSPQNAEECEICLMPEICRACHLFVDDETDPTQTYWYCRGDSWAELSVFCEALDQPGDPQVHFVSIHDDAENQQLTQQLPLDPQGWGVAWIGLRNAGPPEAPEWVWDDGTEVDYHRLGSSFDGYEGSDPCVSLRSDGDWSVGNCLAAYSFICEAPVR